MNEWNTYGSRLLWAMNQAGKTNQSELARAIGVKPQSIQYLCNPDAGAQGSIHTPALARELGVQAQWLARGEGSPIGMGPMQLAESAAAAYTFTAVSVLRAQVVCTYRLSGQGHVECLDLPPGESDGYVQMPQMPHMPQMPIDGDVQEQTMQAVRIKGNALSPFVKDGQFLLLQTAGADAQPEENVVITLRDGRVLVRELLYQRDGSAVVLPIHGGQPEAIEQQQIARMAVIVCVLPRRWWRG